MHMCARGEGRWSGCRLPRSVAGNPKQRSAVAGVCSGYAERCPWRGPDSEVEARAGAAGNGRPVLVTTLVATTAARMRAAISGLPGVGPERGAE